MRTTMTRAMMVSAVLAVSLSMTMAQDFLRKELFGDCEALLSKSREMKAEFYAPTSFQKAMSYYNEGLEKYNSGKSLEDIREKINNAEAYFAKALDAAKKGEETFRSTSNARNDATTAGALKSSLEIYNEAEEKFIRATFKLEDGDETSAMKAAREAESMYRTAELEAIKSNFLSPARELLRLADEADVKDNAPLTVMKSERLVRQVESLLKGNRYDTDSARDLARLARYEAAHAIYLNRVIAGLKKQDKSYEVVILEAEMQFQRVAGTLGIRALFDNGFEGPVNEVNGAIKSYDQKLLRNADTLHQLVSILNQKDSEIENLRQQVNVMQTRLGTLSEAEKKLQEEGRRLEQKLILTREQENIIRRVSTMFTPDEASLLRQGDDIVLRVYGVSFPVGRSSIEAEYYPLLTKVQEAIKKFPNCSVTIQGNTDSQGPDDKNQSLSESRARAVAEYLMANMNVQIAVNSQGFGESRPIATNDTPEGRAKNRRIDVVISPEMSVRAGN